MTDTVRTFQKLRHQTRLRTRVWVRIAIGGAVVFATPFVAPFLIPKGLPELFYLSLIFGSFSAVVVAIICINLIVIRDYRCPECDGRLRARQGVLIDPEFCPDCGARLK